MWCPQVIWEGIPQAWGSRVESPVAHGVEFGVWDKEKVLVGGTEGSGGWFWFDKFFQVGGCIAIQALVCEEGDFIFCPESYGGPMK